MGRARRPRPAGAAVHAPGRAPRTHYGLNVGVLMALRHAFDFVIELRTVVCLSLYDFSNNNKRPRTLKIPPTNDECAKLCKTYDCTNINII